MRRHPQMYYATFKTKQREVWMYDNGNLRMMRCGEDKKRISMFRQARSWENDKFYAFDSGNTSRFLVTYNSVNGIYLIDKITRKILMKKIENEYFNKELHAKSIFVLEVVRFTGKALEFKVFNTSSGIEYFLFLDFLSRKIKVIHTIQKNLTNISHLVCGFPKIFLK